MTGSLLEELIASERERLRQLAKEIMGHELTDDDLLQPNDYPLLESNPHFRYQEGIVAGLLIFQTAKNANPS
jgi:hypothetical protein